MDFFQIKEREAGTAKKPVLEIYPDFKVVRSKDLMVRAKGFYAIWDEEKGLWSTDEYDVQRLVDEAIANHKVQTEGLFEIHRKYLANFSSSSWLAFRNYVSHVSDNHHELDSHLTFRNTPVKKEDYVSRRLPYDLVEGPIDAWDELVGTLYDPENRAKIEWAIGALVTGDSKTIQKFLVYYGSAGTGKSTILNIIQWLFESYWVAFVSRDLVSSNNSFALEAFKNGPLVAIEHDGDLSRVQDNSKLNSLVAHEMMEINEKNKPKYMARFLAMLMIGSNSPVKITDSRSGLIRRLIDVHPTGKLFGARKYQTLMSQIQFELGAIAWHCREVYLSMGKDYYSGYKPIEMMLQTDVFFNFIESNFDIFSVQDGTTLTQAYKLWQTFCAESGVEDRMPRHKLRHELTTYFEHFEDRAEVNGVRVRSWFSGFKADRFKTPLGKPEEHMYSLVMDETESLLDRRYESYPAQYTKEDGTPKKFWDGSVRIGSDGKEFTPKPSQIVSTTLKDIDTKQEHYVKVPEQEIVIDFDLADADGKKSAERNLEKASLWPSTYAEFSKSGEGIHLHYNYLGDVSELASQYDDGIEIKVYKGNSALRRRLTRCNNVPVADLAVGALPIKEKKSMLDEKTIKDEAHLRALIAKGLRKEIHPGTKSNVDYIHHVLDEAYRSGMTYDVTDMRNKIITFAATSSHQSLTAINVVKTMQFKSEDVIAEMKSVPRDERIVIFDVEVFPNLFVVCWKYQGAPDSSVVAMVNPSAEEIEQLITMKLLGYNCRRYDNHILYGAAMGFDNRQLYELSQKLINGERSGYFGAAYGLSYADNYEYASKKQSLKKWQIELGLHHMELGIPWDQPVPEELWEKVVIYCKSDVNSADKTFEATIGDFVARQILADLSGLSINSTTQQHTAKIVFGEDRKPQDKFVYTDLSEMFPGYKYDFGKSTYKGEEIGEGGLVRAKPGMYANVVVLDVASMHPTSIEQLNLFGEYTKNFADLKAARIAIKRGDYESARKMLGGKLARHLTQEEQAEVLSYALKIVINIVYGLTAASFDNSFRDPRNIDNIVAKRGALFMKDLQDYVEQELGFSVIHIKTDSIKVPVDDPKREQELIDAVTAFGARYGYEFEHESTYSRMCLVNDAVYIAKVGWAAKSSKIGKWEAVGAEFQHPYVFKYLFSQEDITFADMCETKQVQKGELYLDFGDDEIPMAFTTDENNMLFVGRIGLFCPIEPGAGGANLWRKAKMDDGSTKLYAVAGTKGFKWLEADMVKTLHKENDLDGAYYEKLVTDAIESIERFGKFDWLVAA